MKPALPVEQYVLGIPLEAFHLAVTLTKNQIGFDMTFFRMQQHIMSVAFPFKSKLDDNHHRRPY